MRVQVAQQGVQSVAGRAGRAGRRTVPPSTETRSEPTKGLVAPGPGAVHAFTNPEATAKGKQFNLPLAYDAEADKKSKAEMTKFFSALFKP